MLECTSGCAEQEQTIVEVHLDAAPSALPLSKVVMKIDGEENGFTQAAPNQAIEFPMVELLGFDAEQVMQRPTIRLEWTGLRDQKVIASAKLDAIKLSLGQKVVVHSVLE